MIPEIIPLNDGWQFQARALSDFAQADGWSAVRLPHTNVELPISNFDETAYQIESSYRRYFASPPLLPGQRVLLHFDGVMAAARVWVNGHDLGEHRGGYTPFAFDITERIKPEGDNLLAVLVDSRERPDIPPFGFVIDYLTFGGIYREVWLELRNELRIEHVRVQTRVLEANGQLMPRPILQLDLELSAAADDCTIRASLAAQGGEAKLVQWESPIAGVATVSSEVAVTGARLWDCEHPQLYSLELELIDRAGKVLDSQTQLIGFREAAFKRDGFFLNGQRLKLRGLNRHQSWPYVGYAMPARAQKADADNLRFHLGCNVVRQSHYPQSRHFLDRCDQIGLLVFAELPGWQHIGDAGWQAVALENLRDLILRDRNHPSVIIWGVRINESADHEAFYRATNRLARELDPSRPTGGVRNFSGSQFLEDVYTYNDFVHAGGRAALDGADKIAGRERPYLVSEHNGHMFPTKKADPEPRRIEQALRHARVLEAMYASRRISGAIGWCMADYNTHGDFGSGDHICHHGVQDMFRIDKLAAALYRSQQDAAVFGLVANSMCAGDHDGAAIRELVVFTNSAEVKVYKGERFIGSFRPDRQRWPHLPHPPIRVHELIGNALEADEGLSPRTAAFVKRFLLAHHRKGGMPFWETIPMLVVMLLKKWGYTEVYNLFARHINGWGSKSTLYRFEGWTNGNKDWEQWRGPSHATSLAIKADEAALSESDSWDCCRVEVRLLDALGNDLVYCQESVTLEVDGPLEIIGPAMRQLSGGSTAFWLKTTGKPGKALIQALGAGFRSDFVEVFVQEGYSQEKKAVL